MEEGSAPLPPPTSHLPGRLSLLSAAATLPPAAASGTDDFAAERAGWRDALRVAHASFEAERRAWDVASTAFEAERRAARDRDAGADAREAAAVAERERAADALRASLAAYFSGVFLSLPRPPVSRMHG